MDGKLIEYIFVKFLFQKFVGDILYTFTISTIMFVKFVEVY